MTARPSLAKGRGDDATQALESAAFPAGVRALAAVLLAGLLLFGLWLSPRFAQAQWSAGGLALFAAAALMVLWMGAWIVRSRTRLEDGELSQTWVWHKRVHAADAASVKLVDIPGLRQVVAPRLLVRRRGGGMTWFHSADPRLLTAFCTQVARTQPTNARR
ncbi:hypothetical protein [Ottowia sp.]|uniref:hypothetical protein n=1 Tax=Ottowia sp. TaxID=1898956 RepID=UPI0039E4C240